MPKRIFLDSHQTICESAAEHLLSSCQGQRECPDLGRILVCLPGKLARKVLTQTLAERAPYGLLSPEFVTAGLLLKLGEMPANVPGEFEDQLLWYETVSEITEKRIAEFSAIFPCGTPPMPNLPAEQFRAFRNELVHNNLSISEVADILDPTTPERGIALAKLESAYLEKLKSAGYEDPLSIERAQITNITVFAQYDKIILLNMLDLPKILRLRLEHVEQEMPGKIEVWIHAPESCREDYDDWGVVRRNIREHRGLEFPDIAENCSCYDVVLTPEDAARQAIKIAVASNDGALVPDDTAVILADTSLLPAFQNEFAKVKLESGEKIRVYDPSGVPMSSLRFCQLGNKLTEFLSRPTDFHAFTAFLRNADILFQYSRKYKIGENRILKYLDEFEQSFHPDNLNNALTVAERKLKLMQDEPKQQVAHAFVQILDEVISQYKKFTEQTVATFLCDFLTDTYLNNTSLETERTHGVPATEEIDLLREELANLENWEKKQTDRRHIDDTQFKLFIVKLFWKNLGITLIPIVPEAMGYPVEGCLEIPFLSQKHIIFCGLNDGWYPDKMPSTPFLNDSIRERLGLRCNDISFSRAICYMRTLIQTRQKADCSVHFLILTLNADKDTMKPSSLFFCGDIDDEELKKRVKRLFQSLPISFTDNHLDKDTHNRSFYLKPDLHFRKMENDEKKHPILAVTDFSAYLESPLRYFLARVLQMGPTDYLIHEMDAREFGTVCHKILYLCGDKMTIDVESNRKILDDTADQVFTQLYGTRLPVLVGLQKEIMLQRLHAAAPVFCNEIENGYDLLKIYDPETKKILALEYKFGGPDSCGIEFHGALIRGTADRIEFNHEKQILRIIDYKTGDVKNVKEEHYSQGKNDGIYRFKNLQLPLYVMLLQHDTYFKDKFHDAYPGVQLENVKIETAYFVLPKAVTQTKVVPWSYEEMQSILAVAERETGRIIDEIMNFEKHVLCENPAKRLKYDDFKDMLLPNPEDAVIGVKWEKETR